LDRSIGDALRELFVQRAQVRPARVLSRTHVAVLRLRRRERSGPGAPVLVVVLDRGLAPLAHRDRSRALKTGSTWKREQCPVTFFPAVRRRRSDWKGRGAHSSRRRRTRARFTYAHDRVYIMFGSITKPAYDAFYANFMKVRRARDLEASDRRRSDR
jgi:hypothetical protein